MELFDFPRENLFVFYKKGVDGSGLLVNRDTFALHPREKELERQLLGNESGRFCGR